MGNLLRLAPKAQSSQRRQSSQSDERGLKPESTAYGVYFLKETAGDGGDHYGGDVVDGNHYLAVLLYAFDDSFHSGEGAVDNHDAFAGLAEIILVVEIDETLVFYLSGLDEVLHLCVGHCYDGGGCVFVLVRPVHDVAQWLHSRVGHLEVGDVCL